VAGPDDDHVVAVGVVEWRHGSPGGVAASTRRRASPAPHDGSPDGLSGWNL
jgi:hypothetical protein